MAAVVTGLVGVAIGLAVRHVNKRRQNQHVTRRQSSMATNDSDDDDVEDVNVSENIKSAGPSGAIDMMQWAFWKDALRNYSKTSTQAKYSPYNLK